MDELERTGESSLSTDEVEQALAYALQLDEAAQDELLDHFTHQQRPLFEFIMKPCLEEGMTTSQRGLFLLMVVLEVFYTRFPALGRVTAGRLQREKDEVIRQLAFLPKDDGEAFKQYLKEPALVGLVSEYLSSREPVEAGNREYDVLFPLFLIAIHALHDLAQHPPAPPTVMIRSRRRKR